MTEGGAPYMQSHKYSSEQGGLCRLGQTVTNTWPRWCLACTRLSYPESHMALSSHTGQGMGFGFQAQGLPGHGPLVHTSYDPLAKSLEFPITAASGGKGGVKVVRGAQGDRRGEKMCLEMKWMKRP